MSEYFPTSSYTIENDGKTTPMDNLKRVPFQAEQGERTEPWATEQGGGGHKAKRAALGDYIIGNQSKSVCVRKCFKTECPAK